jgi:hypothetical protein
MSEHTCVPMNDCEACFEDSQAEAARISEVEAERDRAVQMVSILLGDLSDAERAINGWKFTGGMGANIAQEDRGRFPTLSYRSHRAEAEALLSSPSGQEEVR